MSLCRWRICRRDLYVRWDVAKRQDATLLLDGKAMDLQHDPETDRGGLLVFTLPLGEHTLRVMRGGVVLVDQPLDLATGKRTIVNVDSLIDGASARVCLVWPAAERAGATLMVDGHEVSLTLEADSADDAQIAVTLSQGDHTIRITHPDFEDFERSLKDVRGTVRLRSRQQASRLFTASRGRVGAHAKGV